MPSLRAPVFVTIVAVAACGGESSPEPPTHVIDTRNGVSGIGALLVAYEQGGRWRAADEIEDGVFEIAAPDRALGIAVVCNDPVTSGQGVTFEYLVLGDEPDVRWSCYLPPDVSASLDVVPGTAVVTMRGRTYYPPSGAGASRRTVAAQTVRGQQDLVATTDTRLLVRRDVAFPLAAPVVLDVETDGVPFATVEIAEPDAGVLDLVTYRASLVTANRTVANFPYTPRGDQVQVAPAELLIDGDQQRILIGARAADQWRGVEATASTIDAMRPHLVLPPEQLVADVSWGGRPELHWTGALGGTVTIGIEPDSASSAPRWIMIGSPEWQAAVGGDSAGQWRAPDLAAVGGWHDAWNADVRGDASWWVSTKRVRAAGDVQVAEYNEVSGYAP
jgi:hypothetical protein